MDCVVACAPLRKRFAFVVGNDVERVSFTFQTAERICVRIPAARYARVVRYHFAQSERAQGTPGACCTRGLVCKMH